MSLEGITVKIDNVVVGTTDNNGKLVVTGTEIINAIGTYTGTHTVSIESECYTDRQTNITMPVQQLVEFSVNMITYSVDITSEPFTKVYVDGSLIGETDSNGNFTFESPCPGGIYTVKLVKTGYYDLTQDIEITNDNQNFDLSMEEVLYNVDVITTT